MVRAAACKSTVPHSPLWSTLDVVFGVCATTEENQSKSAAPPAAAGGQKMVGGQPRAHFIEAELLAGEVRNGGRSSRPPALFRSSSRSSSSRNPCRRGFADELEHVAIPVGKIGHQPFPE